MGWFSKFKVPQKPLESGYHISAHQPYFSSALCAKTVKYCTSISNTIHLHTTKFHISFAKYSIQHKGYIMKYLPLCVLFWNDFYYVCTFCESDVWLEASCDLVDMTTADHTRPGGCSPVVHSFGASKALYDIIHWLAWQALALLASSECTTVVSA